MIVTKIESVTKTRFQVFIEGQFAFVLYKGELSRYRLTEGGEISHEQYELIRQEVVLKRAKLRALHLLNAMDRTEEQLRTKLKQNLYPDDIIDAALDYVKSFGYVQDEEYARRFVMGRQHAKSKRELSQALYQKGIAKDQIERVLESCYEEKDEKDAIQRLMEKRHFDPQQATDKEKKKMYDYLLRKGFRYEDVRQVIQVSLWNA